LWDSATAGLYISTPVVFDSVNNVGFNPASGLFVITNNTSGKYSVKANIVLDWFPTPNAVTFTNASASLMVNNQPVIVASSNSIQDIAGTPNPPVDNQISLTIVGDVLLHAADVVLIKVNFKVPTGYAVTNARVVGTLTTWSVHRFATF
jgi:hypothetical protein